MATEKVGWGILGVDDLRSVVYRGAGWGVGNDRVWVRLEGSHAPTEHLQSNNPKVFLECCLLKYCWALWGMHLLCL